MLAVDVDGPSLIGGVTGKMFRDKMRQAVSNPPWLSSKQILSSRWNPYSMEGGSTVAVAGDDFVVVAGDTRFSQFEVNILTRHGEKVHQLSDRIVLNTSGFQGDSLQLRRVLDAHLRKYRFDYREELSVDMCAHMLSRTLYYKRFFPYYTGVTLAGIDESGKGAVFSYDPIGTLERIGYEAGGASTSLMQPFLDHQIGYKTLAADAPRPELTLERVVSVVKDAFRLAAERETTTGDSVSIIVLQHNQPANKIVEPLRED